MLQDLWISFVVSGDTGNALLFTYPHARETVTRKSIPAASRKGEHKASSVEAGSSVDGSGPLDEMEESVFGVPCDDFAGLCCPKLALSGQLLQVGLDRHYLLISFPVRLPADSNHAFTLFNTVFILRGGSDPGVVSRVGQVARLLSRTLEHEEVRCGFLSLEAQKLFNAREQYGRVSGSSGGDVQGKAGPGPVIGSGTSPSLCDLLLARSRLADHLKEVRDGLVGYGSVHVLINGWLHLHLSLHHDHKASPASFPPSPLISAPAACSESQPSRPALCASYRPYQTLLLTRSPHELAASLPADSSPQLRLLLRHANPCRTFHLLEQATDLPLPLLYRLAAHLVRWGYARVIDVISPASVYTVAPLPLPHASSSLLHSPSTPASTSQRGDSLRSFPLSATVSGESVSDCLSRFSLPRPLSHHLCRLSKHAKRTFVQQLVWLLQRGLLIERTTHVIALQRPRAAPVGTARASEDALPVSGATGGGGGGGSGSGSASGNGCTAALLEWTLGQLDAAGGSLPKLELLWRARDPANAAAISSSTARAAAGLPTALPAGDDAWLDRLAAAAPDAIALLQHAQPS